MEFKCKYLNVKCLGLFVWNNSDPLIHLIQELLNNHLHELLLDLILYDYNFQIFLA